MRRHLSTALEGHNSDNALISQGVLSIEEEVVALVDAEQQVADLDADIKDGDRIIDTSNAMENTADIVEEVIGDAEPTPAEQALIQVVGDAAVAGTELPVEEIVPAIENYSGGRIATEGFRQTARDIWDAIVRMVKKIWERIEKVFYNLFGTIPTLRKRIRALEERLADASGKSIDEKTFSTGVTRALSINHKMVKSEAELKRGLDTLHTAGKEIFGVHMDAVASAGDIIADGISDFDPDTPEESAKKLVGKLTDRTKTMAAISLSKANSSDSETPGYTTTTYEPLLGNISLRSRIFKGSDTKSVLGMLELLRFSRFEAETTNNRASEQSGSEDFATMSVSGMRDVLSKVDAILEVQENYNRGKRSKDIAKTREKIKTASAKAKTKADKIKDDDAAGRVAVPYYRGLLNLNLTYASWVGQPATRLASSTMASARAAVGLVERSLAQYKAK